MRGVGGQNWPSFTPPPTSNPLLPFWGGSKYKKPLLASILYRVKLNYSLLAGGFINGLLDFRKRKGEGVKVRRGGDQKHSPPLSPGQNGQVIQAHSHHLPFSPQHTEKKPHHYHFSSRITPLFHHHGWAGVAQIPRSANPLGRKD